MKRYIITLVAILTMTATLSAQKCINLDELREDGKNYQVDDNIQLDSLNGLVVERTISVPDKTQDELFAAVSNWVKTNYSNSADTAISITNLTNTNIEAKGHIGYLLNKKGKNGIDIKPKLTIAINDGFLTVYQCISQYEIWNYTERGLNMRIIGYQFNRLKTSKATAIVNLSQCYPYEKHIFFKTEEESIDALQLCLAYEDKILEEIQSVFNN